MTVTSVSLADAGFVGEFWPAAARGPAVLVISGSAGGHPGDGYGAALLDEGFSTLALTYFGVPGLPGDLHDIPIEYFHTAVSWLRDQVPVDPNRVSVIARSRGTEAAQLLALYTDAPIASLVLGVPSYVVVKAYPGEGAAWTLHDEPIPYHPNGWPTGPFPSTPPAVIPLEDYSGPVMLVSAGCDQIWPSTRFAQAIKTRRDAAGRTTEHWDYPDAGHSVGTLLTLSSSHVSRVDATAHNDAWQRTIRFLRTRS